MFVPNVERNKTTISVELHAEPPQNYSTGDMHSPPNQQLPVSSDTYRVLDTSNTSSTEEELIERFHSKCEMYKRCGYKLIDHRKEDLQSNNGQATNSPDFRPQLPSTSPPRTNETTISFTTKFSSLKIEDS